MYAVRTNKKNKKEVQIRCTQNYNGLPQLTFSSNLDFLTCGPVLLEVLLNLVEFNSIQFVYTTTTMVLSSYEMNFRFLSPPPTISQLSFHTVRLTFPLSVEKIPARILPKIKPISLSLFPGVAFLFCKEIYLFFLGNFEKNITPLSVHSKRKSFSLKTSSVQLMNCLYILVFFLQYTSGSAISEPKSVAYRQTGNLSGKINYRKRKEMKNLFFSCFRVVWFLLNVTVTCNLYFDMNK